VTSCRESSGEIAADETSRSCDGDAHSYEG
jgi:hypothetical protein